jgi:predicted transcriptional regulator
VRKEEAVRPVTRKIMNIKITSDVLTAYIARRKIEPRSLAQLSIFFRFYKVIAMTNHGDNQMWKTCCEIT